MAEAGLRGVLDVAAETGDAGGVSITGGKSPPLVKVALSFVVNATDGAG